MFCGYRHLNVDHSSKFVDGKVHINGCEPHGREKRRGLQKRGASEKARFAGSHFQSGTDLIGGRFLVVGKGTVIQTSWNFTEAFSPLFKGTGIPI